MKFKDGEILKFRELKVGELFRFKSAFNFDEIRRKVSYRKYADVYNGEGRGVFDTIKSVKTRETLIIKINKDN